MFSIASEASSFLQLFADLSGLVELYYLLKTHNRRPHLDETEHGLGLESLLDTLFRILYIKKLDVHKALMTSNDSSPGYKA